MIFLVTISLQCLYSTETFPIEDITGYSDIFTSFDYINIEKTEDEKPSMLDFTLWRPISFDESNMEENIEETVVRIKSRPHQLYYAEEEQINGLYPKVRKSW
uniref:Secreted protein n=1 Tax=Heterorhabditis bacteriophora TaxID=37862 RepID=A0A1I7XM72_HETBA